MNLYVYCLQKRKTKRKFLPLQALTAHVDQKEITDINKKKKNWCRPLEDDPTPMRKKRTDVNKEVERQRRLVAPSTNIVDAIV